MTSDSGLFNCTQCGDCCKGFGGNYVSEADMKSIAGYIGVSKAEFKSRYCVPSGKGHVLAQGTDGYCAFYKDNCRIHPVKPQMCRKWPFISSLQADIQNWRIMASVCPGMRTDMDDDQLRARLNKVMGE